MSVRIDIANLQIGYRNKAIGSPFSASIDSKGGTLILLVGRNGSGKSTLLRTLSGLQSPLAGDISVDGQLLRETGIRRRATLMSMVQTTPPHYTDLTVGEVVALGAYPLPLRADDDAVIEELQRLGIEELIHRRLDSISDGERQKAMIARALIQDTPIIFMDEPTAFLDFPSRIDWWKHVAQMRASGKTLIVSTHDLAMVKDVDVDRFWLLNRDADFFTALDEYDEVLRQLGSNA
jgi:iron complex transport system ATP-binding protein